MPKQEKKIEQRRLRTSYFTSTLSISLLLLLLGIVGLLLLNTNRLSNYVKENIHFKVILNENLREVDIFSIQKSLDVRNYVKETKYIDKDEAAVDLQNALGEDFIETLGYNPLLPTIEVKFLASYANNDSIPVIENDLKEFEGIKEVYYQKNLIQAVNENVKKISLFILFFSAFLFLIALTLINNTIRMSVYSKRFIIRTMQLVGATSGYIRKPFLYRGTLQGILGASIAIAFMVGFVYLIQDQVSDIIKLEYSPLFWLLFLFDVYLGIGLPIIAFWYRKNILAGILVLRWIISLVMVIIDRNEYFSEDTFMIIILFYFIVVFGILLNWISTYFAVTKYLKIKTDKLYT